MPAAIETEEVQVRPLSPEQITRDRAAARANPESDGPMDAEDSDVIGHPSTGFNAMAEKLEKAMSEVNRAQQADAKPDDASPKEMKQASSKKESSDAPQKPEVKADDEIPATITGAKAADWKALKEKVKTHEAQAKEWETKHKLIAGEYEEFRKKAGDTAVAEQTKAERDAIKAERDKLQTQLETIALERSERFSGFYQQKFDEAMKLAKDAAGDDADRVEQLMALPPTKWRKEQLNSIREMLSGIDQGQLDNAITEYDRARNDRESKLKDSKTNFQKLMEVEAQKAAQEKLAQEQRTEAITVSVLNMAKDYDSFKTGDDAAANAAVSQNEEFVKKFVRGRLDGPDLAMMPILAIEAKRYKEQVVPAMAKEIKELKESLAQLQGANPAPSGGGRTDTNAASGKGFIDRFNELYPQGNR